MRGDVAIATATRVVAVLREEGLIETRVGSGSVVRTDPRSVVREPTETADGSARRTLGRRAIARAAITIADAEGLEAVSMRSVASACDVSPMSLYRHVEDKAELVRAMTDEVFAEAPLPNPGPEGWRAKLEVASRTQWSLCRRHPWLPQVISFTRPRLAPHLMEHTEWMLGALDESGMSMQSRIREVLTLSSLVVAVALSYADELAAARDTGIGLERWWSEHETGATELVDSDVFPRLARVPREAIADFDKLFEHSLARHLDGLAAHLGDHVEP